ncbi:MULTISPECIES: sigma-E processing peptidase SpoIIGA [Cytobacillus]|uniref:Sporulation sigma-E factor-processing peptidase n=1 Tax=Cytobacillus stercorigallinarum TaxID=2762240 RepID=A0ABR8QMQ5_9BACI|nr:sigma-E processing peptidase SpoIIGA [Cytobacillus stercorigallinarum]MBD7936806.1 sigma-E processing peptidase SpoIIGA [Cytobacillus stercorigallinarum]
MAIYLDIIWALNLLFDSLLLYLTSILLKIEVKLWRIATGGLVGSIIILLSVTPIHAYSSHPIGKWLFSIFMVFIVFGFRRLTFFLKALSTFYAVTFLIGGSLIAVHYFIQFDLDLTSTVMLASVNGFGDPISWLFVLLGFPIAWHFSKKNYDSIEMTKINYESNVNVQIQLKGETYDFQGLIDSGNQLYDPLTRVPVMIVSIDQHKESFPEAITTMAKDPNGAIEGRWEIPNDWMSVVRVIPAKVVGSDNQMILALKPEKITLIKDNEVIAVDKGLISFTMQKLSPENRFQCIVHPKMLTGAKKVG